MTTIPYTTQPQASFNFEDFLQSDLFMSNAPAPVVELLPMAASTVLDMFHVVGFNGSNQVLEADNATIDAIGVTMAAQTSAAGQNPLIPVLRVGHINIDMLTWNAAYNTDALKTGAFAGQPSPTQILADFNKYNRV